MCRTAFFILGCIVSVAVVFLLVIEFKRIADKRQVECYVDYLRQQGEEHECFETVGDFYGDELSCNETIEDIIEYTTEERKHRINLKTNQRQHTNCVTTRLKSLSCYRNNVLLARVLEYSKLSWKFWNFFDRQANLQTVQHDLVVQEDKEIASCKPSVDIEIERVEDTLKSSNPWLPAIPDDDIDNEVGSGHGNIVSVKLMKLVDETTTADELVELTSVKVPTPPEEEENNDEDDLYFEQ